MRYLVDPEHISHERMQDEVIIINMTSGAYYSGSGCAADCWTLLSQGVALEEAATALAHAYGADIGDVRRDIETAANTLISRGLLRTAESSGGDAVSAALPEADRAAWAAPEFDEYTDMWDLLQADPIHDVGEAGWPYSAPQKA